MINLEYYKGKDRYSDGSVENTLLRYVENGLHLDDIPPRKVTWPIYYHLSPVRRNLLNWYPFEANSSILEVGAGCGALTPLLCELAESVTAVELSKKRATIIDARCKSHRNLEIIVGNLTDIEFSKKFDYVTVIGVLEYAPAFIESPNPAVDFLKLCYGLLKPGGTILIAIENQFGLKYFAGAKEDHLGKCFAGIEGYRNTDTVRTFGKHELERIIRDAEFDNLFFYYPIPDYKLPNVIYSDQYLPDVDCFFDNYSPNYDQDRYRVFNERNAMSDIIRNGQFPFFANSFLVEAVK